MAVLSGKSNGIVIAMSISVCFAGHALAATVTNANNQQTQSSTEVFDVKEKDIQSAPIAPSADIPPPDFKEFEDDKFINDLLGENGKTGKTPGDLENGAGSTQPPAKTTEAPGKAEDVIIIPVDKTITVPTEEVPQPIQVPQDATPAQQAETPPDGVVPAPSVSDIEAEKTPDIPAQEQQPALTQTKTEAKPDETEAQDTQTAPESQPLPGAEILTDAERTEYTRLRQHLRNFMANSQNKTTEEVAEASPVIIPEQAPIPSPASVNESQDTAMQPAPQAEIAPTPALPSPAPDELTDLLEEDNNKAIPSTKEEEEEEKPATSGNEPASPDTIEELPVAAPAETPDIIEEKPYVSDKPNAADKAYLKLLEKKREASPDTKPLSGPTRETAEAISQPMLKNAAREPQYIKVERGRTGEPASEENGILKSQNRMNLSVRTGGKNEFEKPQVKLEKAYKALMVGQSAAAISIYKEVLNKAPHNKDAMFGLATAYHKNNQFDQARTIYTELLKKEPGNKEALNNFLILIAEESPKDALVELEKLERVNSDFSPIPAQIAMIHLKLGDPEKASRYLRRAILISPDNISYKYNLAVIYDTVGQEEQAVQLYQQVMEAIRNGAVIPGSVDKLNERLSYLERKIMEKR